MSANHAQTFGRRASARTLTPALPRPGWTTAGVLALLCSGVAWASLPRVSGLPTDEQHQWQALSIAPLANGGATGMRMAGTDAVAPVEFVPHRAVPVEPAAPEAKPAPIAN